MFENLNAQDQAKMTELLKACGSQNMEESQKAQAALAGALEIPLRQGILVGNIIGDIYEPQTFDPNARVEYPIDFFRPDNATDFIAYTVPNQGRIPERQVAGDYVTVPTYDVGASIDWLLRYSREARWDIVSRAMEVLEAGVVKKLNDDGFHTLLAALFDRNIIVSDGNAAAGQFTKRLVSLAKVAMRRNAGGNKNSLNRGKLTNIILSPESLEDMRNWGIDIVDEFTRREIFTAPDDGETTIYGVKIAAYDEFGVGMEYQTYYTNVTAVSDSSNHGLAASDVELVIGLDLSKKDSFVMPVREPLQVFSDPNLHRSRKNGFYCWTGVGFAVLNNLRCLGLSL